MSKNDSISYTTLARRIALKYPFASSIGIQMNFWTIGYILLFSIVFLGVNGITKNMDLDLNLHFGPPFIMALFLGLSYGFIIGSINHLLEDKIFVNKPLWVLILMQGLLSMLVLLSLVFITRTYIFERLVNYFASTEVFNDGMAGWPYLVSLILIYTFMMTLLISFINQMNRKFGPGILIPMLLGHFRKPREEERIFMFLDLKGSTFLAEKLGHVQYSSFIRDCFQDINHEVKNYLAEIYQYVGDEIVLSWNSEEGIEKFKALEFYFSCKRRFQNRLGYYKDKYAVYPEFKAGLHIGLITVVEVGDIKRDIAYHGDTLNVTSRIEHLCKEKNEEIIISSSLLERLPNSSEYTFRDLGLQNLRGRKTTLKVFSVQN